MVPVHLFVLGEGGPRNPVRRAASCGPDWNVLCRNGPLARATRQGSSQVHWCSQTAGRSRLVRRFWIAKNARSQNGLPECVRAFRTTSSKR